MTFHGTTGSLGTWTAELDIERETDLAHLLITYEQQLETEGATPDATLLTRAESLLQERLRTQPLDSELAHLGYELFGHLGKFAETRALLEPYRTQRLDTEPYEAAWAWWVIDDCLALERKASELVQQQTALLRWSLQQFPTEQCLFAISDGTQADCWWLLGQRDGWFALFNDLMSRITPTQSNREDRFYTLRTAAVNYIRSEKRRMSHRPNPFSRRSTIWWKKMLPGHSMTTDSLKYSPSISRHCIS